MKKHLKAIIDVMGRVDAIIHKSLVKVMSGEKATIILTSSLTGKVYEVKKHSKGEWTCSCPDFKYRGHRRPCKHLKALWNLKTDIVSVDAFSGSRS